MISLKLAIVTGMLGLAGALALQTAGSQTGSPFFCNLNAFTKAERTSHQDMSRRMLASLRGIREVPDGYAFDLDSHQFSSKDLASWVELERRCCPFFDFRIERRREDGPVTLQLTGRPGVKDFIRAEFASAFQFASAFH
jgi:hypothetical protein